MFRLTHLILILYMKTLQSFSYSLVLLVFIVAQTAYPFTFAYAQEESVTDEVSSEEAIENTNADDDSLDDISDEDAQEQDGVQMEETDDAVTDESTQGSQEDQSNEDTTDEEVEEDQPDDEAIDEDEINLEESLSDEEDADDEATQNNDESLHTTATSSTEDLQQTTSTDEVTSTSTQTLSTEATTTAATSTVAGFDVLLASTTDDSETTTIVSGQAVALANILNMVNSNFVNSEGVVLFSNFFEAVYGAIDFRQYFAPFAEFGCSLVTCQGQDIAVNIDNNASIDNEVLLSATSGGNEISDVEHGVINTGDAYAGLNLINVANTNLVDSNYLLVTLNAFQGVNGDIVFPSLTQFFSSLAHGASTPQVIDIENTAGVENIVSVEAEAGGNTTSDTQSSTIQTGDAVSGANVFNQLNSSLVGGQSVAIVFRVHGSWAGEIFGAPDDLAWTVGDDGSMYLFDVGSQASGGELTMHGTSTASIRNNVSVVALTGENAITNAETAVISTGNAYAGANIINVANANVVGRNWILAVINIFGDFNGNIAFGRPDLWVGGQIDVPASIENGTQLEYTFTIINNGDSPASDVAFTTDLNGNYLSVLDASHPYEEENDKLQFNLDTIPPGGAVEVAYTAQIVNTGPGTAVTNTARVLGKETDNNVSDNTEVLTVRTDEQRGNGIRIELSNTASETNSLEQEESANVPLVVSRLTSDAIVHIGSSATEEEIVLKNDTDRVAKNVVLHDILRSPSGELIRDEVWELGNVLPGEEIMLGYEITFNPGAAYGVYTLQTNVEGENVDALSFDNGAITYELIQTPVALLLTSLSTENEDYLNAAGFEQTDEDSQVYIGKETPLIPVPAFAAPLAQASENTQLAAVGMSGFPLDPLLLFFVLAAGFFVISLVRLYTRKA